MNDDKTERIARPQRRWEWKSECVKDYSFAARGVNERMKQRAFSSSGALWVQLKIFLVSVIKNCLKKFFFWLKTTSFLLYWLSGKLRNFYPISIRHTLQLIFLWIDLMFVTLLCFFFSQMRWTNEGMNIKMRQRTFFLWRNNQQHR